MIVEKNKVVSIDYNLSSENGDIIDSTHGHGPLTYLHGARNILPKLEEALEGKSVKARVRTILTPEDAYGDYDDRLVQSIPLEGFPNADKVVLGTEFELETSQGPALARITRVENGEFTVDMNHPLAGETLHFDVQVMDIREATEEELEHGHVHNSGCGCGHDH